MSSAQKYSDKSFWQRDEGRKIIEALEIPVEASVLDVGCGTGELTLEIAKIVGPKGKVTGIDPDASRIELARKIKSDIEWLNVSIGQYKTTKTFDYCFANYVLHWIDNQAEALEKISDSLVPKGKFGFTVIAFVPQIIQAITRTIGPDSRQLLDSFISPSRFEWTKMVNKAGFRVAKAERYSIEVNYGKLNDFFDWWVGTSHGIFDPKKISPEELRTMRKMFPGDLIVDHPLISVIAEKL